MEREREREYLSSMFDYNHHNNSWEQKNKKNKYHCHQYLNIAFFDVGQQTHGPNSAQATPVNLILIVEKLTLKIGMMSDSFSFLPLSGQIMLLRRISLSTHSMVTMSPLGRLQHHYITTRIAYRNSFRC